jgi:hypothetical protein
MSSSDTLSDDDSSGDESVSSSDTTASTDTLLRPSNSVLAARAVVLVALRLVEHRRRRQNIPRSVSAYRRYRVSVRDIYRQLGPTFFRRAYRMSYGLFRQLSKMLHMNMLEVMGRTQLLEPNYRYIPNGSIGMSVRLACAIRYFAGGSPYDLMTTYQISYSVVMRSVWFVVHAINCHSDLAIQYPEDHTEQQKIADGFKDVSAAGFNCCAGAIDGILLWILKPSPADCESVGVGPAKFFCGRKHKFGMNCQAVCDARGQFLDISILFPGATSDCVAFEGMTLYQALEGGLLAPGLCFFGDNAYINSVFMATPYSAVTGGTRDAYNFYHSQVRIRIECAFGMLTNRWAILRKALPLNMSIKRSVSFVIALAKLHNYCITQLEADVPTRLARDEIAAEFDMVLPIAQNLPPQPLGGGHHSDDVSRTYRRRRERQSAAESATNNEVLPREQLHGIVADLNLTRPTLN